MSRRFSVNYALFSMALDAILIILALLAATYLRPHLGFLPFAAHYPQVISTPWSIYLVFVIEWLAIAFQFTVYDGRRNIRAEQEFTNLTIASLLASMAMAGTLYITIREISRLLFITFIGIAYLAMLGWRVLARLAFRDKTRGPFKQRNVLIVGNNEIGNEFHRQINTNPNLKLNVIGYLDNALPDKGEQVSILGSTGDIHTVVREQEIDDVIIALPGSDYSYIDRLVRQLHSMPVKVWLIPDYFRLALHRAAVEEFAGLPMLDLRAPALSDTQRLVKRGFDLAIGLVSIMLALPLFGIISLAIWLQDRGTVILRQERVGENGQLFEMYKFRTMTDKAEELRPLSGDDISQGDFLQKRANDPRVTPLGRILRRSSLDELPQLINVIKGDMSLVGPRPELPFYVDRYETWQRQRFAIPQGITGWWQIKGRSENPMHLNTEDDIYYVQNYSLWLDIYILAKTVQVVIQGTGAF